MLVATYHPEHGTYKHRERIYGIRKGTSKLKTPSRSTSQSTELLVKACSSSKDMALFTGITVKHFSLVLRYLMVSYLLKAGLHLGDVCSSADAAGYNTEEVYKRMLVFKDVITGKCIQLIRPGPILRSIKCLQKLIAF